MVRQGLGKFSIHIIASQLSFYGIRGARPKHFKHMIKF